MLAIYLPANAALACTFVLSIAGFDIPGANIDNAIGWTGLWYFEGDSESIMMNDNNNHLLISSLEE